MPTRRRVTCLSRLTAGRPAARTDVCSIFVQPAWLYGRVSTQEESAPMQHRCPKCTTAQAIGHCRVGRSALVRFGLRRAAAGGTGVPKELFDGHAQFSRQRERLRDGRLRRALLPCGQRLPAHPQPSRQLLLLKRRRRPNASGAEFREAVHGSMVARLDICYRYLTYGLCLLDMPERVWQAATKKGRAGRTAGPMASTWVRGADEMTVAWRRRVPAHMGDVGPHTTDLHLVSTPRAPDPYDAGECVALLGEAA